MMRKYIILLLIITAILPLFSQSNLPKREFRAAWVATVLNIDFPPKGKWNSRIQQQEFIRIIEELKSLRFNAVIVQIRPAADALYPSSYEPWSAYLTGQSGKPPVPYYDPLQFMIDACHERGMEFHAWINPYRGTMNLDIDLLSEEHPVRKYPDWFFTYGTKYYFKPSKQEVRNHITEVIGEIVEKYDVDGIHFDDYFYPYKIKDLAIPDALDYAANKGNFTTIEDWRRHQVDLLIEQVATKIKSLKSYVQFGISPFGVWRNREKDPVRGSNTRAGVTCYDDLYADVLKWLSSGWIDYVAPQIYWHIGHPTADFQTLVHWWNKNSFGKPVYIGHAAYKVKNDTYDNWSKPEELSKQIREIRPLKNILGSIYYNTNSLRKNPLNIQDSLQQQYAYPALLPVTPINDFATDIAAPSLKKVKKKKKGLRIKWKRKGKTPHYYVVYKFYGQQIGDMENPKSIWYISPFYPKKKMTLYDPDYRAGQPYTYLVSSLDRTHLERTSAAKTIRP